MDKNLYKQMMDRVVPSAALIQKTKSKMKKEKPIMIKRSFGTVAAAFAIIVLLTTTVFAAWHLLKPSEVVDKLENPTLSAAFDSETAVYINQSSTSGDYTFTLLAIVSGKDITDQPYFSNDELRSDRSYIVTAIQRADGAPMPSIQEDGFAPFYISPYVNGQQPWMVNAHTLGGGAVETFVNGIVYRLVEFDNITMFAGRGVYIGISDGSFPNNQAFLVNGQTGELNVNPDYDGISILFNLPIDPSLANPEKAKAFLDELLGDTDENGDANIGEAGVWIPNEGAANRTRSIEITEADAWTYIVGEGLVSQQEMTRADYIGWMEKQLSAGIADREFFERYLKFFDNGQTITIYTYEDGNIAIQVNN